MITAKLFTESTSAKYVRAVRATPRSIVANWTLLFSCAVYAMAGLPTTWDQGSSSVVPSLKAFQKQFNTTSGANASEIQKFISIIYIGYAAGAAMSFFINDRIGRRWSLRLYAFIWILGQTIASVASGWPTLYTARIVSGLGIGALSVTGPMSLVEIAPSEIRGLLTSWYSLVMGVALTTSIFCAYGTFKHLSSHKLQYQVVWFSPALFMGIVILASFFISESPRWLMIVNRKEEAIQTLTRLRRLPTGSPRLEKELDDIQRSIEGTSSSFGAIVKETFTVSSNLRRLQQVLLSYAFAQLSGANSVTSYFVPILNIIGIGTEGGTEEQIFLSGMYGLSKFLMSIVASFFLIDALGRRKSLFMGISLQMISHIYLGIYIKYHQEGSVPNAASQAAVAALFIHALGYSIGLFILPYVFGSELWPNRIRSFGSAVGQIFHWLFLYAMKYGFASLLKATNNWGAFLFYAGCCALALVYVFFVVPEVAGLSVEEIDGIFRGSWFNAYKRTKQPFILDSLEHGIDGDAEGEEHMKGEAAYKHSIVDGSKQF